MKNYSFKLIIGLLFGLMSFCKMQAQTMTYNPNDKECVISCYPQSVRGNIATVKIIVDGNKKYYYEYNWKTRTGKNGEKCSWERDVMEIAYKACKNGISLEKVGFIPQN